MEETIKEILKLAVHAPSGHNSQPWRFVVKGDGKILIWNLPDKDKTLFNYRQRGSLIAHGAVLENVFIIASEKGYEANIRLFPEEQEPDLVAEVNFEKTIKKYPYQHLLPYILQRSTNRKPYKITPLKDKDRESLETVTRSLKDGKCEIALTQDRKSIHEAAVSLSMGDRLLFENFYIHQALFSNVNWTLRDEQKKREGLYVGTKELSLFERLIFKYLLSRWGVVHKLQRAGISTKAALKRQKLYEKCSAIGILTASSDSPVDFIEAGRVLQRFWLTATSLGLSFQPVSVGLLYLGQQIQRETPEKLTTNQLNFVREAYKQIIDTFNISQKIPVFSFRVGYSIAPTARSLKKAPTIMTCDDALRGKNSDLSSIGIVFIGPIIGLTPSLMNTFRPLENQGASIIGVDIFGDDYEKKSFWKILKLTMLPGSHSRRISFANSFLEHKVFDKIESAIRQLVHQGKTKIILGGMSGGFTFAARVIQSPPDHEIEKHTVRKWKNYVTGLFGVSPLIFYPEGIHRPYTHLESIPSHVKTLLFFGDQDTVIPPGTREHAEDKTRTCSNIQVKSLGREEFGKKSKPIKHQFFGGKDFVGPLKNPFWYPEVETYVVHELENFLWKL